ncbi:N-formylglutamate amidohydrolase [Marinigracilibium pacificum]|uniref:N-formylglutamate amidohydrolase n=1 Tax=Marinigracilibium pacificum TaxID=2729599 RepID=A0A848J2R0_9BACT|nr:N-formylglutamate amidohydrolase [Marinigracilibium pacificum]NMM47462.1 N-formylglutamate amidohydrolase [Marinigracilibium pacificum]
MSGIKVILTCEHGGYEIPEPFKNKLEIPTEILSGHRGWDPGAYMIASEIEKATQYPMIFSIYSRLLVDLNRSVGNPELFSEYSHEFSKQVKQEILSDYYFPYRRRVEEYMSRLIDDNSIIIHLGIHTFNTILNNEVRDFDIGLLYDETRILENKACYFLRKSILKYDDSLKIKYNAPYKGTDDGLTTYFRSHFPPENYLGIEIEINNRHFYNGEITSLSSSIIAALKGIEDLNLDSNAITKYS